MESIGEKLRQTRESKGYTIEQIARDTHIAKRFLEALEDEDFSVFPGDPYLLGFMRTYSEYLGLESEAIVALYKNLKLQEQPAPIDELISKNPSRPVGRIVLIIAAVVVVLGVGSYFLFFSGMLSRERAVAEVPEAPAPAGAIFELTGEWVEQRFGQGDRIVVPVAGDQYAMDLTAVTDVLAIDAPEGKVVVEVGEEISLDLNGDERPDVRLTLRSVDTLDSPPTVVMRVNRGAADSATGGVGADAAAGEPVSGEAAATGTGTPAVGSTNEPSRQEEAVAIVEFAQREEYFVEVRFEGYSLFRYEVDDEPRVEQYFQQGQTLRTSVRDQFRLWVSNAGVARMRVAGQDITLGSEGQVTAALITWADVPDSSSVRLELVPVY
ncbi:MAG: helix-turn-helix domain-containing protein [Spirochaetales bacterium]|nr:helix-turn-helix domain-containing protein [Spirochaetales bacterium]